MAERLRYALGIDFGGTASKATLLSERGELAAVASVEYPTSYPKPGWAEQNPDDWYAAVRKNIAEILNRSAIRPEQIAAVCLDAATHTAVLTDDDFRILRPAIHWTDSRSVEEAAFLSENFGEIIVEQTLHRPDTIWTLPQLLWLQKREPEIWSKTRRILFAKDYVRHRLTGDYVTDDIEAAGSMFFNARRGVWSEALCETLGFPISRLPKIVRPGDVVGRVTPEAAEETGLLAGTPLLCGTTDTALEVFAAGAVAPGQTTVKLATAGRICVITDRARPDRSLVNYPHIVAGLWYPGTATKSCAASLRWFRDAFGGDYAELDRAAALVPPGSGGLLFHPYLTGELTPYADPSLCGSFIGIRASHGKGDFARAVLEGVALSLLDCRRELERIGISLSAEAAILGGGAKSPLWRQIVADTLGITLCRAENGDSSFGAAMLAGVAAGFFADPTAAVRTCRREMDRTIPNPEMTALYGEIYEKYRAVHDALCPIYR